MRLDLVEGAQRPWYFRLMMTVAKWRVGMVPGPPFALTYRPKLFHKQLVSYLARGAHGSGGWTRGESELFGSFVSDLNACHF